MHILLVDDDDINIVVTKKRLENRGYHIDTGRNGLEAIDECLAHTFDLILLDVSMPILDGIRATEQIRALGEGLNQKTPIIGYMAHMHEEIKRQCMDAGMDDVLVKPVMTDALIDKITYWTQRPYFSCPRVNAE